MIKRVGDGPKIMIRFGSKCRVGRPVQNQLILYLCTTIRVECYMVQNPREWNAGGERGGKRQPPGQERAHPNDVLLSVEFYLAPRNLLTNRTNDQQKQLDNNNRSSSHNSINLSY